MCKHVISLPVRARLPCKTVLYYTPQRLPLSLHLCSLSKCRMAASSSTRETRTTTTATVGWWFAAWTAACPCPSTACTSTTRWWIRQSQLEPCRRTECSTSPTPPMSKNVSTADCTPNCILPLVHFNTKYS